MEPLLEGISEEHRETLSRVLSSGAKLPQGAIVLGIRGLLSLLPPGLQSLAVQAGQGTAQKAPVGAKSAGTRSRKKAYNAESESTPEGQAFLAWRRANPGVNPRTVPEGKTLLDAYNAVRSALKAKSGEGAGKESEPPGGCRPPKRGRTPEGDDDEGGGPGSQAAPTLRAVGLTGGGDVLMAS